ncbi:restriction endonuclease [Ancylobacter oerskovii]|uniref:Restriction endonuclease n=1 Tax=Ancylobacter oerskovii TaxID=459519 RepID=A0ABW4Z4F9_9HYPH|nr:restriction endonuclease [Ancylobacter oerskovii]MBS7545735.1 restriction endonuclease [Ancylobacter oerskovii]
MAIEEALFLKKGLTRIASAELAERLEQATIAYIAEKAAASEKDGVLFHLQLLGSSRDYVAGFSHPLATESPGSALARQQRRHVADVRAAIQSLSFSHFERFCARILILMGASEAKITPHSGDQGIDFHGTLTLGQFNSLPQPFMQMAHDIRFSFLGQAKHYPNSALSTSVVRELIGAVSLARTKTFSSRSFDGLESANIRPFSPIVTILFTTGTLSRGARELSSSAGIISRSGEQLAVFLVDHSIGVSINDDELKFDKDAFEYWLLG